MSVSKITFSKNRNHRMKPNSDAPQSFNILYDAATRDIIIGDAKIIIIISALQFSTTSPDIASGLRARQTSQPLPRASMGFDIIIILLLCAACLYHYINIYNIISCYLSLAIVAHYIYYESRVCANGASVCERHVRRRRLRSYCSY